MFLVLGLRKGGKSQRDVLGQKGYEPRVGNWGEWQGLVIRILGILIFRDKRALSLQIRGTSHQRV